MSASEDQTVQRRIALPGLSSNQMSLAAIVVLLGVSYMFNSMDRQVFPALLSAIRPTLRTDAATGRAGKRDLHGDGRHLRRPERLVYDPVWSKN
jgi:hypothetical protein